MDEPAITKQLNTRVPVQLIRMLNGYAADLDVSAQLLLTRHLVELHRQLEQGCRPYADELMAVPGNKRRRSNARGARSSRP